MISLNKKAEFNFVLLFAVVAGTVILLLAIYGAVKTGDSLQTQNEGELAKSLDIITNPLQAGFSEGSTSRIVFKRDTRINNNCEDYSKFGENVISVQTRSSIGDEWSPNPLEYRIYNKYLFTEMQEGKTFFVFSKPFYTGYKVADLIFISTKKYCFVYPPEKIEQEIIGLNIPNIGLQSSNGNNTCAEGSEKICFGTNGCERIVVGECTEARCNSEYDFGVVKNADGSQVSFSGSLMYGAIFAEKETYECNVRRLLYRSSRLADLFSRKIDLMAMRGCSSLLKGDLDRFSLTLGNSTTRDLQSIYYTSNDLDKKEAREGMCGLW